MDGSVMVVLIVLVILLRQGEIQHVMTALKLELLDVLETTVGLDQIQQISPEAFVAAFLSLQSVIAANPGV